MKRKFYSIIMLIAFESSYVCVRSVNLIIITMGMKLFLFNIACIVLIISSCSHSGNFDDHDVERILIEVNESNEIKFSHLFDKVEYVPLETTDSSLIGAVEKFRIFDDKVCVLCDKSLLLFDANSGKNELGISKLGNAPGEYISLYDVFIDKKNDLIELLDMNGRKIQKYDFKGNFKESLVLPFMSFSFNKDKYGDYWFYNNNTVSDDIKSKVICFDSKRKNIIEEYFPIDFHLSSFFFVIEGNNFVRSDDGMLFFSCPLNKIYSMNKRIAPKLIYNIDFGIHNVPTEFYKENYSDIMDFSTKANKRGYIYFINNLYANKQHVMLSYLFDNKCFWNIYSINEGRSMSGHFIEDDINSLSSIPIDFFNTFFAMDEDSLYFLISVDQFMNMCKDNEKFLKLADQGIDDQSNPILVKCKFKKNI